MVLILILPCRDSSAGLSRPLTEHNPQEIVDLVSSVLFSPYLPRPTSSPRSCSEQRADRRLRAFAAGQCLAECKEWDMCLAVLGEDETGPMDTDEPAQARQRPPPPAQRPSSAPAAGREMRIERCHAAQADGIDAGAACCLLRGKVYDMQQNRAKASHWYQVRRGRGGSPPRPPPAQRCGPLPRPVGTRSGAASVCVRLGEPSPPAPAGSGCRHHRGRMSRIVAGRHGGRGPALARSARDRSVGF